MNSNNTN